LTAKQKEVLSLKEGHNNIFFLMRKIRISGVIMTTEAGL